VLLVMLLPEMFSAAVDEIPAPKAFPPGPLSSNAPVPPVVKLPLIVLEPITSGPELKIAPPDALAADPPPPPLLPPSAVLPVNVVPEIVLTKPER
jgi:hypothetical protein